VSAPDTYPPQLAVGVTSERIKAVSPTGRVVHRAILHGFAERGRPPTREALIAVTDERDLDAALDELHDRDVVRLEKGRQVLAAYPFSTRPTRHVVDIAGGPSVHAMCAIDALGIPAMLGRDATIRSTDPHNGRSVTVTVYNGQAAWMPDTTVVYVGAIGAAHTEDSCHPYTAGDACGAPAPVAERCCTVLNFFTAPSGAHAWLADHPEVTGRLLTQEQALRLGADIFGRLLED
jgi:hypothetical protein